jgi:hypothetical protein
VTTKPERTIYTANDLLSFRESQSLELTPRFQRREVWKTPARSFFIDTLLRGYPVPPIYIRVTQSKDRKRTVREVIDGQQRLRALLAFIDGEYALTNAVDDEWCGRTFSDLNAEHQTSIREFPFIFEVLHGVSDSRVLEIFARLNTYSVPLNKQELRNGTYFGLFKQVSYNLAYEHVEFWRVNRIFTEGAIARMLEVELTSELLILAMAGLQDKKNSINSFYADYDAEFPKRKILERRFRATVDEISQITKDSLEQSEFRRPPLFYSLFAAIYHQLFGVPNLKETSLERPLRANERKRFREAIARLSDVVVMAKEEETVPRKYAPFVAAALRQTDNIQPRLARTKSILDAAL